MTLNLKKLSNFPREKRLVNQTEYDSVFEKPKKTNQDCLLALSKTNTTDHPRLGIIVSKRVAKNAITRNTIKRIVRESFRVNQHKLKGLDIIILARQNSNKMSKTDLRRVVEQLWEKILKK